MINGKSSDDLLSKAEAMGILGIKSAETMSRIAKRHGISAIKEWKSAFYPKDEILKLKESREKDRTSKKPNANFKEKKREELILKKTELALMPTRKTPEAKNPINANMQALIKELKNNGTYEACDKSLIYSYCENEARLIAAAEQMGENFITYDHNGNEKPSALFKVCKDLLCIQSNLAKALGLGAGNRKGLEISEIIEVDEMDKLLNG